MIDFHDKFYYFKSDHVGDPNKPQEGSHKTSSAFVSNMQYGSNEDKTQQFLKWRKNLVKVSCVEILRFSIPLTKIFYLSVKPTLRANA